MFVLGSATFQIDNSIFKNPEAWASAWSLRFTLLPATGAESQQVVHANGSWGTLGSAGGDGKMGRWCLPFREPTYLTNGKRNSGNSSSQLPFGWDMFVRRSVDGFLVDNSFRVEYL